MWGLDGHYRHAGTTTTWDDRGVTVQRSRSARRLRWTEITSVRRRQDGSTSYVQLVVRGHVGPALLEEDAFAIPVASESDSNRLLMSLGWRAQDDAVSAQHRR